MTTPNGRTASFAHFLGLAPRKSKTAPKPANVARASSPTPTPKATLAPKTRPRIKAATYTHLLTDLPAATRPDHPVRGASPAEQAARAYRKATGQSSERPQAPKPGSAAEQALSVYRRVLPGGPQTSPQMSPTAERDLAARIIAAGQRRRGES